MACNFDCNRTPGSKIVCGSFCIPPHKCPTVCFQMPNVVDLPRPPPPPPPPPYGHDPPRRTMLLLSLISTATLIGAIFMVCFLVKKLTQYRRSRRNGLALFAVRRENLPDDDDAEGPIMDHHIWYIHTVGLQQSVIDSITMFKYRKDEKLIDGADCTICLGEFQEDESLRLLPKCSHAFHLPCIDTWLRSHKNCPLCRAPIVLNSAAPHLTPIEPISNSNHSPPAEDTQMEMEEENRGDETSNSRSESEIPIKGLSRTLSDLSENQNREAVENEGQGLRRSVSMDSVSALAIYQATANIQVRDEGSSSGNSVSRNVPFPKRGIGNQSLYNLVKTISFGRSIHKGAISMKRFSSSSRKLQWPSRHFRSQSSVLPL